MDNKILTLALQAQYKPEQIDALMKIIGEFDKAVLNGEYQNIVAHMLLGIYQRPELAQQVLDQGHVFHRMHEGDEVEVLRITGYNDFTQTFSYEKDDFEWETRYYDSKEEKDADTDGTGGTTEYKYRRENPQVSKRWKTDRSTVSRSQFDLASMVDTYHKHRYQLVDPRVPAHLLPTETMTLAEYAQRGEYSVADLQRELLECKNVRLQEGDTLSINDVAMLAKAYPLYDEI